MLGTSAGASCNRRWSVIALDRSAWMLSTSASRRSYCSPQSSATLPTSISSARMTSWSPRCVTRPGTTAVGPLDVPGLVLALQLLEVIADLDRRLIPSRGLFGEAVFDDAAQLARQRRIYLCRGPWRIPQDRRQNGHARLAGKGP